MGRPPRQGDSGEGRPWRRRGGRTLGDAARCADTDFLSPTGSDIGHLSTPHHDRGLSTICPSPPPPTAKRHQQLIYPYHNSFCPPPTYSRIKPCHQKCVSGIEHLIMVALLDLCLTIDRGLSTYQFLVA